MVAILAGFSLGSGVLWGLVLVILFIWVITKRFIVHEEQILRDTFGAEAEAVSPKPDGGNASVIALPNT